MLDISSLRLEFLIEIYFPVKMASPQKEGIFFQLKAHIKCWQETQVVKYRLDQYNISNLRVNEVIYVIMSNNASHLVYVYILDE